jgi:hypothetical protein
MSFLHRAAEHLISRDLVWRWVRPWASPGGTLSAMRNRAEDKRQLARDIIQYSDIFRSATVLNGPFAGMKYPSLESAGSALYPKILGSYERELSEVIVRAISRDYQTIVNIGSGEGYYAVGMALRTRANIIAVDTDVLARNSCTAMATLNNVSNRVILMASLSPQELKYLVRDGKTLIISDCEGYEELLFTEALIPYLEQCDLIVETHDFIRPGLTDLLAQRFLRTHYIEKIDSLDDDEKANRYQYSQTENMDQSSKRRFFAEGRPQRMTWLSLLSRAS